MVARERPRTTTTELTPAHSEEEWQPILLRVPASLRQVTQYQPLVLVRTQAVTMVGLLVLFLCLQFLIPARLVIGGMGAAGRPSVAVGILLAFLWLVSAARQRHLPRGRQPIRWVIGLFVVVQVIGYVVGFDRLPSPAQASAGTRWLLVVTAIAGVTLSVADGLRSRAELDRVLKALIALATVMSCVGVLQFLGIIDLVTYIRIPGLSFNYDVLGVALRGAGIPRVAGTANHYIEFGVVLALALPIALHYALFAPRGSGRWWRWVTVGIIAMGIPLSVSRSAIVTVAVGMVMLAIVWPWRQRYNALVISVLATAVFHVVNRGVLGTIRALFTNVENDPSVTARIERTAAVVDLWHQRPLLGWGSGMVTPEEFLLLDNQIYGFLLSGGLLGILAFLVLFFVPYMLGRSVRLRGSDQETRHLGQALAATMPAAVVTSGTFDSFSFATFVGMICILIGATGALWRLDGISPSRPLRAADPGDKFVATPLMANVRRRVVDAWQEPNPATLSHLADRAPGERMGGAHVRDRRYPELLR